MTEKKKLDSVVYNTETKSYDAALKPYATSVGAPVITQTDTTAWKNRSINKVNHKIKTKYLELKAEYEKMMQEFEYNNLILNANFSFEPIIGETYHLYLNKKEEHFLSLIAPEHCNFNYVGSFVLNADQIWEKV
ncbi:uncharacterized protein DUF2452 [Tenacibaculum skagerrakense]|uniref:Uncharacterized protein DUF2452 n=1 Tax=Tenacibaculum skagerrakense TaxID=186571 RepID=A0A4R2NUB1_9FLAO|nr:DUF2452 domain-containing protein [Tenacibaculum skagerrakense]TCP25094.1 uncharacterized protein DUF2452 [Tenacibaculum skagerrakense]